LAKLESDKVWCELELLVKQLLIGAVLPSISGTGPIDEMWTSGIGWREYTALSAQAGDEIVVTCKSCHTEFKPDLHTMKIYDEISSTANR
jgi:hypothetical protein